MNRLRLIACCTLLGSVGLCCFAVAQSQGEPLIPDAEFKKIVEPDANLLTDLASKGALDRRSSRKEKVAAYLIDAAAHTSMGK